MQKKAKRGLFERRMPMATLDSKGGVGRAHEFLGIAEGYRPELLMHCYRMLGSFHDAEDVVQDSLVAAWQGLVAFEGRASLRTWLYKPAINRLNPFPSAS